MSVSFSSQLSHTQSYNYILFIVFPSWASGLYMFQPSEIFNSWYPWLPSPKKIICVAICPFMYFWHLSYRTACMHPCVFMQIQIDTKHGGYYIIMHLKLNGNFLVYNYEGPEERWKVKAELPISLPMVMVGDWGWKYQKWKILSMQRITFPIIYGRVSALRRQVIEDIL